MDTIKDILLNHYPNHVGYTAGAQIIYPCNIKTSDFSLGDSKACMKCAIVNNCNQIVMNIKTDAPVAVLEFETFVNQFGNKSVTINGKRCDYLLYDPSEAKSKIAFCELTCSDAKFVESNNGRYSNGKRAHAYQQVKNSLEHLLSVPVLDVNILTYPSTSRYGVFGWREKNEPSDDKVLESLADFIDTPSAAEPIMYTQDFVLGHNFTFIQVKYPFILHWN